MKTVAQRLGKEELEKAWGQRITSLAVFDGRVCAATGNRGGTPPESGDDPVPSHVARSYGEVFCALVPGHTMMPEPRPRSKIRFVVTGAHVEIHVDGRRRSQREHRLDPRALQAIAAGRVTVGQGSYGGFRGSLRDVSNEDPR
jgi:hypothetical protein